MNSQTTCLYPALDAEELGDKPQLLELPLTEFYFLRHGESTANAKGVYSGGACDVELTEIGLQQAYEAAQILKERVALKTILASPLKRAYRTAEICGLYQCAELKLVPEFREWMIGSWEGRAVTPEFNILTTPQDPPGGETRRELESRIVKGLQAHRDCQKPLIIVAHGVVGYSICRQLGISFHERMKNAAPYWFYKEQEQWNMKLLS